MKDLKNLFIYVLFNPTTADTICGLMDGPNADEIAERVQLLYPKAQAVHVGRADDKREASPIHYADVEQQMTCCIYAFFDPLSGGMCSGLECVPVYHPDLIREKIQMHYPGAQGILIGKVDNKAIVAKAMSDNWVRQRVKGGQA